TAQQKVAVKVSVTDDVGVGKVKWAAGTQGESYFTNSGTEIANDSIVNITSNGYYTFYAEDQVGNKQVYTLNVTNVDLTAPVIDIQVSPETTVGLTANVTINYGDSTIKQYKVGTSNATWSTYTNTFAISSYTILTNNWQNADGTITIYAKGKDTAGNEVIVQKKVVSLDLDRPKVPVINSNAGYATLTSNGVKFNAETTIVYDNRTDIDNYYSIDNGSTWKSYTGMFTYPSGTIIAKSIKKTTGLETVVSRTIGMPVDAVTTQAYDGNDTTGMPGSGSYYLEVDSSMIGSKIRVKWYSREYSNGFPVYLRFMDQSNQQISFVTRNYGTYDDIYTIPANTKKIKYESTSSANYLYEIQPSNEPTFTAVNGYILVTADPTKSIKEPYQNVTIGYFSTSVQRLYRIGTTGNWLNYNDQPVKVNHGQTIYAKGIDQYGNETRIVSSYTVNVLDAVKKESFDNNDATGMPGSGTYYIDVDTSVVGSKIRVKWYSQAYSNGFPVYLRFMDQNNQQISFVTRNYGNFDDIYTIPANTKRIKYESTSSANYLYEIQVGNEPTFSATNGYMLLTADPTKAIRQPYQNVTINYFPTSVIKLYRIGASGTWQNYNNQPIIVNNGEIIYAKGIDQYGNESRVISSYTSNTPDAIKKESYDNNDITNMAGSGIYYMEVDSSMVGRRIRVRWYSSTYSNGDPMYIRFLDSNKNEISYVTRNYGTFDDIYTIPSNTKWIKYQATGGNNLYEIQPSNEPTFTPTNGYMLLHANIANAIREPYQMIVINYFPTSVQKLYRIGTVGEWLNYNNEAVKVNHGLTIYAKGIDVNGVETRIISSYTSNVADAIKKESYDGNDATSMAGSGNYFVQVDSSSEGKKLRVRWYSSTYSNGDPMYIRFLDSNKNEISFVTRNYGTYDDQYNIPINTRWIRYQATGGNNLYELNVINP
ncbi:MAG: hypothetical protein K0R72_1314, partial [Clostridia bacterium]|nr:hypothetical protein [Clostridia bacterium]